MGVPIRREPIAVVGVSALFPGSTDAGGFWRDILAGRDLIADVPPTHWLIEDYYDPDPSAPDKTYAKRGAFLSPVEFDPLEHGVPPNIVPATDTSQLLALIVAKQVLEDATRSRFDKVDRDRVSVILGVTSGQELLTQMASRLQRPVWVKALREHGLPESEVQAVCDRISASYVPWQESTFPGLLGNVVAGRIANRLNLGGTNCITDAACASSLSALSMGVSELHLGDSDLAIVGGVETFNDIFMYMCFSKTPALSPTGDCRPFSATADGTMLGEGLGMVALRRLSDAERDGDRIYAVIRGIGTSSDGRAKSVYAPVPEGQAKALRRAYEAAGYGPETVELIEAHGTGTKAGDAAEYEGLRQVFDAAGRADRQWCALGSVKSQVGHTKAAAGAAGLFKAVMALHHKVLPPTIKVTEPNPSLRIEESPFYLNTEARPWIRESAHPRRAGVSSFGFGGSNFHVALEEYEGPAPRAFRLRTSPTELVVLTAADPRELALLARKTASEATTRGALLHLARSSQAAFRADQPARLAIVASDEADLAQKLTRVADVIERNPTSAYTTPDGVCYAVGETPSRIGFLFPGQGSQYLQMGLALAMSFDDAREVWDRAAALKLDPHTPLHEVVFPRPVFSEDSRRALGERLTGTDWAQPALGAASAAQLALLRSIGVKPDVVGGHSFGEVSALFAAGVFDLEAFLRVARRRGELMAEAADQPGAMLAVAHGRSEIEQVVEAWGGAVAVANHNSPRQVVLSGPTTAIEETAARLRERGITARRLSVATAFHSPLVSGSTAAFREFLETVPFGEAAVPVFAGALAAPYPTDAGAMRAILAEQIARPVRFVEQIEAMYAAGVRTFVEVGPGAALSGLVGEILEGREHAAVSLDRKGVHGLTALWHGLGRLAVRGVPLSFGELWVAEAPVADPGAAAKRPALTLKVHGGNYGRPYPPAGGAAALPRPNPERPVPLPVAASVIPETQAVDTRASAFEPPVVTAMAPAGLPASDLTAWAQAYQEVQRHTAEAHAAYQRAMADSHAAFLKMTETSVATLGALLTGTSAATPTADLAALAARMNVAGATRERVPHEVAAENDSFGTPPPRPAVPVAAPAPLPSAFPLPPQTARPPAPATPRMSAMVSPDVRAEPQAALDLAALLLAVVADKTGYPAETLKLEMELEADLGIDSIKRVEILSALQESVPALPEVSVSEMAGLQTLGQIVAHLQPSAGPAAPATQSIAPVAVMVPAAPEDLASLLVAVVAEKTGYPAETLRLDMELEADLGIDSIKRVEILSALQERVPALPDVPVGEMAALRTLGQIVAHLRPPTAGDTPHLDLAPEPAPAVLLESPRPAALTVGRFELFEVPAPAAGLAMPGLFAGQPVIVTPDGTGIAEAVAARLRGMGLDVRVAEHVPADAASVLFLGGLASVASVEQALHVNRQAFQAARAAASRLASAGGAFVTVQDTSGDFGLSGADPTRAWLGGLAGLTKTAGQEWPLASVKAIDLERGGRSAQLLADAIVGELCAGGLEREVGLHADGRRTALKSQPAEIASGHLPVDERSVVVATGGARGVTAVALLELARRVRPRLALLGRTPLEPEPAVCVGIRDEAGLHRAVLETAHAEGRTPSPAELRSSVRRLLGAREVLGTLAGLREAGSEASYVVADVQDPRSLGVALEEIRRTWGPLTGVVHAAGVLADKRIAEKTDEQFAAVFDTKVRGLQALLEATASDPLRFLCLFSSVAARSGNEGQCDYAMANEVLNKVAAAEARRRRGTCVVKSINWGPWDGGMVGPALKARFLERGVAVIPRADGAARFVAELAGPAEQVEVVIGGAPTGRSLLGAPARHEASLDVVVNVASHPYLTDHRVQGTPVVPVVLVLEWFARVAAACRPDLVLAECRNVKVLRGIRLFRFDEGGERLHVSGREVANGSSARLALELRGEDGSLHYTAVAEMLPTGSRPSRRDGVPPPSRPPSPWSTGDAYRDLLFHGPAFQVIRSLEGVGPEGSAAVVVGTLEAGWVGGPWKTDAAALDGGLQLAIVWGHRVLGRPSLPTRVGAFVSHRSGLAEGLIRCTLQAKEVGPHRTVCDLVFVAGDGSPIAELRDVEMHVLPAEGAAPHRATDGVA